MSLCIVLNQSTVCSTKDVYLTERKKQKCDTPVFGAKSKEKNSFLLLGNDLDAQVEKYFEEIFARYIVDFSAQF